MPIETARKYTPSWKRFRSRRAVSVVPRPLARGSDRFFVMGSCFAYEVRRALTGCLGPDAVLPDYAALDFDPAVSRVDQLPDNPHLNTYNPLSVLQEVERVLGLWQHDPGDYWNAKGRVQCPYRRLVFADTPEILAEVTRRLDALVREGFHAADHFIFTYGLTETFLNKASGKAICQRPGYLGGGGAEEADLHRMTFSEVKATVRRTADLILAEKPSARIFVTVSPVPLARTFSGQDIFVANTGSKATLRAALGELAEECDSITYFPSYEAVMSGSDDAFEEDGRHVRRDLVEQITETFVATHLDARAESAARGKTVQEPCS